jgi:hypothetical protein
MEREAEKALNAQNKKSIIAFEAKPIIYLTIGINQCVMRFTKD